MKTAFAQIVTAIINALKATPAVCPLIDRARATVVPDSAEKAVSVEWTQTLPETGAIAGAPIDWQTRLTIECLARSVKDSGDVAVDDLLSAVVERLALDTTLGGLVGDLRIVGIEAENTAEAKKTGWVRLTYIADHRTTNSTLN
jgi:hypothetical protein